MPSILITSTIGNKWIFIELLFQKWKSIHYEQTSIAGRELLVDLNSARIFVSVVSKGSFSAAALATGIPVATVSRRVSELEAALDTRLLERSTRKLRLTDAGATLYEHVSRGVEEMDAGLLAVMEQTKNMAGRLRISVPPNFEPMWQLVSEFQTLYPNVEVELFITERRIDFIDDGLDLAVRIGDVASRSAVARLLLNYRHKVVASPKFMQGKDLNSPDDIRKTPCATWCRKDQLAHWTLGKHKINLSPFIKANDYALMQQLALKHKCITELPPYLCNRQIADGELVEVLPDHPMPEQAVSLVYPSRKSVSRITRTFIDYCVQHFERAIGQ